MAQKIREIMSESPVTLDAGSSVLEAARAMRDNAIGDVLVSTGDRLTGIVTDRDIVVRLLAEGGDPAETPVRDICSGDVVSVAPDDDVTRAVQLVREKAVRRIPVVEGGRPVGVITIGDLAIERDEQSALADVSVAEPNT